MGLGFCISNKFPGAAGAAGPGSGPGLQVTLVQEVAVGMMEHPLTLPRLGACVGVAERQPGRFRYTQ